MFSLADACTFSAKKDVFANIGGLLGAHDARLAEQETDRLILTVGFPAYGGLAGRDLEAIGVELEQVPHPDYPEYRIASTAYLGRHIADRGVPIAEPPGGCCSTSPGGSTRRSCWGWICTGHPAKGLHTEPHGLRGGGDPGGQREEG